MTWRELALAGGAFALPALVAVGVLVLVGTLSWYSALTAIAVAAGVAIALAIPWLRDLRGILAALSRLGVEDRIEPLQARRSPMGGELSRAVTYARRRIRSVQRELEGRALDAEAVIDAVPEPLLVLNHQRRITHANTSAIRSFGGELTGRGLAEVIRHPGVLEGVGDVLSGGDALAVDVALTSPVERQMCARIAPLRRTGGGGEAAVVVFEDLTAARRAEQMRVDFVANVSHELRTPLASLIGFIETLQGAARDDPGARERFLAIMREQADRMSRLVDDLMSLSRIEMEEHNRPRTPVRLPELIESVATALAPLAEERGTTVEVDAALDLPAVPGDADQLVQVFRNLIENAIKYGREGGYIRVTAQAAGDTVRVAVADDGPGIPREHISRLTERFYRVDSARSRRLGGTGLGLAIVKHIVNRHRGGFRIESEVGQGSTFFVTLPVAPA